MDEKGADPSEPCGAVAQMSRQTKPGPGSVALYSLLGIAGALVGVKVSDALEFDFLGIETVIGAVLGAAFFVVGWRQMQSR